MPYLHCVAMSTSAIVFQQNRANVSVIFAATLKRFGRVNMKGYFFSATVVGW